LRAVGDQADGHGVLGVDVAAEGTRQLDPVNLRHLEFVHPQPRAGIERGLGAGRREEIAVRGLN
jgi:hypothetical protein